MGIKAAFERFRQSNKFAVGLVYATLLLDNMLLTVIGSYGNVAVCLKRKELAEFYSFSSHIARIPA